LYYPKKTLLLTLFKCKALPVLKKSHILHLFEFCKKKLQLAILLHKLGQRVELISSFASC